jgi:hypothetical protein
MEYAIWTTDDASWVQMEMAPLPMIYSIWQRSFSELCDNPGTKKFDLRKP